MRNLLNKYQQTQRSLNPAQNSLKHRFFLRIQANRNRASDQSLAHKPPTPAASPQQTAASPQETHAARHTQGRGGYDEPDGGRDGQRSAAPELQKTLNQTRHNGKKHVPPPLETVSPLSSPSHEHPRPAGGGSGGSGGGGEGGRLEEDAGEEVRHRHDDPHVSSTLGFAATSGDAEILNPKP